MSNISVLEQIITELERLQTAGKDQYFLAAVSANLIKYKKQLQDELSKNALEVVEYKIRHLTSNLL